MRFVFVANSAAFFASHWEPFAEEARLRGIDDQVVCPPGPEVESIRSRSWPVHTINLSRSGTTPLDEIRSIRELVSVYRRLRPDLVHHFSAKPVAYGGLAARLASVPAVVSTITGLGHPFIDSGPRARLTRETLLALYRVAFGHPGHRVLFENVDDRSLFLRRGLTTATESFVVPGAGVDVDRFSPEDELGGPLTVVMPGRVLAHKGVREFASAATLLHRRGLDARFVLVGRIDPGNPSSLSAEWLRRNAEHLEWWGHRNDMPEVLARAHVVCLPSYREGLPKVLLEAAACGRPAVTTSVPGCRSAVQHGVNGLLVPVRDASALADALETLLRDRSLRREMGARGRRLAELRYSVGAVVRRVFDVYESLVPRTVATGVSDNVSNLDSGLFGGSHEDELVAAMSPPARARSL